MLHFHALTLIPKPTVEYPILSSSFYALFLHKKPYFSITYFNPIWCALKNLASSFNGKLEKNHAPELPELPQHLNEICLISNTLSHMWFGLQANVKKEFSRNLWEIDVLVLLFLFKGQELWLFTTSNSNNTNRKNQSYLALVYVATFGVRKISHLVCITLLYYCAGTNSFVYWLKLI